MDAAALAQQPQRAAMYHPLAAHNPLISGFFATTTTAGAAARTAASICSQMAAAAATCSRRAALGLRGVPWHRRALIRAGLKLAATTPAEVA